jgi:hypothetical protein
MTALSRNDRNRGDPHAEGINIYNNCGLLNHATYNYMVFIYVKA